MVKNYKKLGELVEDIAECLLHWATEYELCSWEKAEYLNLQRRNAEEILKNEFDVDIDKLEEQILWYIDNKYNTKYIIGRSGRPGTACGVSQEITGIEHSIRKII